MISKEHIHILVVCKQYELEISFLEDIHQTGLIDLLYDQEDAYIHEKEIAVLEKIINLNQDLGINIEGVAVVMDMINKIDQLQEELQQLRCRLHIYE